MHRVLWSVLLGMLAVQSVIAQEEQKEPPSYGWQKELVGNLNFTQTSFSNWAQGGEDAWSWQLDVLGKFVNDQAKFNWANGVKFSFGQSKVGDAQSRKSADELRLESVLTYKMGIYINPYVAVTGETQVAKGFFFPDDPDLPRVEISRFMDPAYFTESLGLGYAPTGGIKTRLGIALKQTVADRFAATFTDDPATEKIEKVRSEVGAESVTDVSRKLSRNILFTSKLELFSTLESLKTVDVRWDNVFSAKVSKYIGVSFNVKLLYDRDISIRRQLKQVLAVGLTYAFL